MRICPSNPVCRLSRSLSAASISGVVAYLPPEIILSSIAWSVTLKLVKCADTAGTSAKELSPILVSNARPNVSISFDRRRTFWENV